MRIEEVEIPVDSGLHVGNGVPCELMIFVFSVTLTRLAMEREGS